MSELSLEQKKAQFDEYFSIAHRINANMRPLGEDEVVPDEENLEESMPYAFRIASEMAAIEAQAIRPLRNLSDHAESLADYLNHQSRKIDLMMSFVLHQQDEQKFRFKTVKLGGGGVVIESKEALDVGAKAELKLFLDAEAAAIFCFGEVITCEQVEDSYHIAFIFNTIREQDQELLVRASLHIQTQQLRKRAKEKKAGSE
ncbi:PilZ domain-containing protein [Alteromonas macleodii]|uniref:PilZ domain-containing protein n=1 Tax=Alteromonas macleodii TaxID=28108 RepID=UPI002980B980|nr:PilZ domain-containing protein [Alteromonas macleodii]MDW5285830.1 PilZ domain-containing protein [Alteromonas macleodii]